MDKELGKLYAEFDKLNTALPGLRSEHNFLVDAIERKKSDVLEIETRRKSINDDIQSEYQALDTAKIEFERYKEWEKKKIQDEIKAEQKKLYAAIKEHDRGKEELVALRISYDTDKVDFEEFKAKELIALKQERERLVKYSKQNEEKAQSLSLEKVRLEEFHNEGNRILHSAEKMMKEAQQMEKIGLLERKIAKEETEKLLELRAVIEWKEWELIDKSRDIILREKKVKALEPILSVRENKIKDKEKELEERDYVLSTKEADLNIAEKRLHLVIKQEKWKK